jgi:prepilin-type N-terminal cleavage/methylation domain-containing protein
MNDCRSRGFSMVEMLITLLVLGLLLAFSIPAFQNISDSYRLHGATENIAAQLRLAREKAISTGATQTMLFTMNYPAGTPYDYHIHNGSVVGAAWALPKGVTYFSTPTDTLTMLTDGRCKSSGLVVLRDQRGNRDTVSVQLSGLVLTK